MKKPLNIGHRGAMGHETENTIASIHKALQLGVDMIEIDVFLLKSGELVVFHDETLDRLTNTSGNIEDFTWEELQKVVLNGNHHIPTLEEVIQTIAKSVPLNIELKGKNTAKPTFLLLEKLYEQGWEKQDFMISSFLWDELEAFRNLDNTISISILTENNPIDALWIAKKLNAFSINPHWKTLTSLTSKQLHQEGFKIYTYTVNELEDIKFVTELGVDGIFCNFPERLNNV